MTNGCLTREEHDVCAAAHPSLSHHACGQAHRCHFRSHHLPREVCLGTAKLMHPSSGPAMAGEDRCAIRQRCHAAMASDEPAPVNPRSPYVPQSVRLIEWITVVLSSSPDSSPMVRNHRPFPLPCPCFTDERAQLTNGPHLSLTVGVDFFLFISRKWC
jgi:hypothetical protein